MHVFLVWVSCCAPARSLTLAGFVSTSCVFLSFFVQSSAHLGRFPSIFRRGLAWLAYTLPQDPITLCRRAFGSCWLKGPTRLIVQTPVPNTKPPACPVARAQLMTCGKTERMSKRTNTFWFSRIFHRKYPCPSFKTPLEVKKI